MVIPFNRPLVIGTEQSMLTKVFESGRFAGNGEVGRQCQAELEQRFGYRKVLLTTSCTSALELSALLLEIGAGDEVIIPSYAFVTTANAFVNRGAKVVFVDSRGDHPSVDEAKVEDFITSKTKAIVALHYGGVACQMTKLRAIADKHSIHLIEDNAQGIGSLYNDLPLGGIGTLGALSFHETKNIHCGEGGAIVVNQASFLDRAEIVWDMGTNRKEFKDGKVNSYGWVDLGSSFYPSALNAAFLLAQLPETDKVNASRVNLWNNYFEAFAELETEGKVQRPNVPEYAKHNGHTFYIMVETRRERDNLIAQLSQVGVSAAFHFQSLHRSRYFVGKYDGPELNNADMFSDRLVRLPIYAGLSPTEQEFVIERVQKYYS